VVNGTGKIEIRRAPGKLKNLEEVLRESPIEGSLWDRTQRGGRRTGGRRKRMRTRIGIAPGSMWWCTTGLLRTIPGVEGEVAARGAQVRDRKTDTEIVAHMVEKYAKELPFEEAVRKTLKDLRGIIRWYCLSAKDPQKLIAARIGPPSVIGLGDGEFFVASDIPALLEHTRKIFFLADGDVAVFDPRRRAGDGSGREAG